MIGSGQDPKVNSDEDTLAWMRSRGDYVEGYRGTVAEGNGFLVAPGTTRTTVGIDFWDKIYVINNPNVPGGKMGVLFMDTQGLWDPHADNKMNCSIYGLSCMLSSYLIANQMGVITSDFVKSMAALTDFSNELEEHTRGKSFQHLDILIRDHPDIDPIDGSYEDCIKAGEEQTKRLENSPAFKQYTSQIKDCFESFGVSCLPGMNSSCIISGRIRDFHQLFMISLGHYVEKVITNIKPRIIDGKEMSCNSFME